MPDILFSAGPPSTEMSWLSLAEGSSATLARTLQRPEPNQAAPKQPSVRVGRGVAKFLEERGAAKDAVRLYASAAQWEYDDEYDDSFDDLAGGTADGLCEAEGMDRVAHIWQRVCVRLRGKRRA
jgi:activating signal cointegrator complex subunit 2